MHHLEHCGKTELLSETFKNTCRSNSVGAMKGLVVSSNTHMPLCHQAAVQHATAVLDRLPQSSKSINQQGPDVLQQLSEGKHGTSSQRSSIFHGQHLPLQLLWIGFHLTASTTTTAKMEKSWLRLLEANLPQWSCQAHIWFWQETRRRGWCCGQMNRFSTFSSTVKSAFCTERVILLAADFYIMFDFTI